MAAVILNPVKKFPYILCSGSGRGLLRRSDLCADGRRKHQADGALKIINDREKKKLLQAASDVSTRAYAQYSKQKRGAAILTESGDIFNGCNVELASWGGSLCAEMSAISAAVAANHRKFKAIALSPASYPCGICRQMLVEFGIDIEIIIDENGSPKAIPLKDLLPFYFGAHNLD